MTITEPTKILVTGATGFVGRNLIPRLLGDGHTVAVVTRPGADLSALGEHRDSVSVISDTGAADLEREVSDFAPTTCVHLATVYINTTKADQLDELIEGNIGFGTRVAHAFAAAGGRTFVYTSTFSQHKGNADYEPTVLYAAAKEAFADILRFYATSGAFKVVDVELFDTFGAGDPRPKIWNLLMNAVDSGVPLDTTEGRQIICPIHVSDVVAAMSRAVQLGDELGDGYHHFHAAGPEAIELREAVSRFEKVNDIEIPIVWGARQYNGNEMFELWAYGDPLPGWQAQVSLDDGFRELWENRTSKAKEA